MSAEAGAHEEAIRVFCRFRPQNQMEKDNQGCICMKVPDASTVYVPSGDHTFSFDRVFDTNSNQKDVYDAAAKPVIDAVLRGFNGTVFAYGQTSSGKTYTMEGPDIEDKVHQGVIPRMVWSIFDGIYHADESIEFLVKVSIVEIYNERLRDLLDTKKDNLKVHEDKARGVFIGDVTESYVGSEQEIFDTMRAGHYNRSMAVTNMNEHSSRSHLVFMLTVEQKNLHDRSVKVGKLHLVDLAGSEKVGKTGATGDRLDEAKNINRSLSALGNVIMSLTDAKATHIPYRDSKLTRVLQESLGGNAKTSLIITCSPSNYNEPETISTLRFGQRAKMIKNVVKVNHERSAEELKILLERREHVLAEMRNRCGGLEQILRAHGIAVPEHLIAASVSQPASPAAARTTSPAELSELFDQVQAEREKLRGATEEITRLRSERDEAKLRLRTELQQAQDVLSEATDAKERCEQLEYERAEVVAEVQRLKQENAKLAQELQNAPVFPTLDNGDGPPSPRSAGNVPGSERRSSDERSRDADRPLKNKVSQLDKNLEQLTVMYHKLVATNSGLKVEVAENDKKIQRKDERIAQLEKNLREAKQKYEKLLAQCANLTTAMDSMGRSATNASAACRPKLVRPVRGGTSRGDGGEATVVVSAGYPSPESSPVTESPASSAAVRLGGHRTAVTAVPPTLAAAVARRL